MARSLRKDAERVYRAVIVDPTGYVSYFGPYQTRAVASQQVHRETHGYWRTNRTGRVQVAETVWKDVEA